MACGISITDLMHNFFAKPAVYYCRQKKQLRANVDYVGKTRTYE